MVLTNREHIIGLEPLENGLMGTLLRYPYEVRDEKEYFDDIQDVKSPRTCSIWPSISSSQKAADRSNPSRFEDHYERADRTYQRKRNGRPSPRSPARRARTSWTSWMP